MCHGTEPHDITVRLLDLTLVPYAGHEFNASAFTMRVIGSTESDMVSTVVVGRGERREPALEER